MNGHSMSEVRGQTHRAELGERGSLDLDLQTRSLLPQAASGGRGSFELNRAPSAPEQSSTHETCILRLLLGQDRAEESTPSIHGSRDAAVHSI